MPALTSITALRRWRSGLLGPREQLYGLLVEHLTPARLCRLIPALDEVDGLSRQAHSAAWFVWRAIGQLDVPASLPVLCQALPQHAQTLTSIGARWGEDRPPRQPLLLEFHPPDGRVSVADIEQLMTSLQEVTEPLVLTAVLYGNPHLRPQSVLLLELSASPASIEVLLRSQGLLAGLRLGRCALKLLHTEQEQLWARPVAVHKRSSAASPWVLGTGAILVVALLLSAIPNFLSMGMRAKRAELPANVDGIKTAQIAYDASFDRFISQPEFVPMSPPSKSHRDWPAGTAFDTLGWAPDGRVRGSYRTDVTDCHDGSCRASDFLVFGISDVDGDGEQATYSAQKNIHAVLLTPSSVR